MSVGPHLRLLRFMAKSHGWLGIGPTGREVGRRNYLSGGHAGGVARINNYSEADTTSVLHRGPTWPRLGESMCPSGYVTMADLWRNQPGRWLKSYVRRHGLHCRRTRWSSVQWKLMTKPRESLEDCRVICQVQCAGPWIHINQDTVFAIDIMCNDLAWLNRVHNVVDYIVQETEW